MKFKNWIYCVLEKHLPFWIDCLYYFDCVLIEGGIFKSLLASIPEIMSENYSKNWIWWPWKPVSSHLKITIITGFQFLWWHLRGGIQKQLVKSYKWTSISKTSFFKPPFQVLKPHGERSREFGVCFSLCFEK